MTEKGVHIVDFARPIYKSWDRQKIAPPKGHETWVAYLDELAKDGDTEIPIYVQQGGSTWELHVQLPDDAEEYLRSDAVDCDTITVRCKDEDGNDLVRLQDAVDMAKACLQGAYKLIG